MPEPATQPVEPRFEDLAGDLPGRKARRLFLATRPKFLTASVLPVVVGSAWGAMLAGRLDLLAAVLAVLATALVHAASNVLNDVGDELTGSDGINDGRIYPYTGGSRFIQNRIMSTAEMKGWGHALLLAAVPLGLALAWLKGPVVLLFGIAGIAVGVLYSLPAVRLSARGVGELSIAIAFGLLPVCGAAWLQSGVVDAHGVVLAIAAGLWVTLILLINEVPDRAADAASAKRTLVVRLGIAGAQRLYAALHAIAFGCVAWLVVDGMLPWWVAAGAVAILAAGLAAARGIAEPIDRAQLTRSIEATIKLQALGSVLLILGIAFAR